MIIIVIAGAVVAVVFAIFLGGFIYGLLPLSSDPTKTDGSNPADPT